MLCLQQLATKPKPKSGLFVGLFACLLCFALACLELLCLACLLGLLDHYLVSFPRSFDFSFRPRLKHGNVDLCGGQYRLLGRRSCSASRVVV